MQNVTVTYDSKIGTYWETYCVSMEDGVMDIENCTVNSVTGGISANSCDAEIVNCDISVDSSSQEELDPGYFLLYGYMYAGIFVSGTSEDDVSITAAQLRQKEPTAAESMRRLQILMIDRARNRNRSSGGDLHFRNRGLGELFYLYQREIFP